ncbi:MAG TPA: hypothetical protein PLU30_25520 [Verrucomicrobiae bacterium]|nr:hypothetical protein [Verrucomicrobiae bacterium]
MRKEIIVAASGFVFLGILGGCATTGSSAQQLYSGPPRSIPETALVRLDPGLELVKFDGQAPPQARQRSGNSFRILPGSHVLTVKNLRAQKYAPEQFLGEFMNALNADKEAKVEAKAGQKYRVSASPVPVSASVQGVGGSVPLGGGWFVNVTNEE